MLIYIITVISIFVLGYIFYGKFLEKNYNVTEDEPVPSKKCYDGIDFVPTNKFVLIGHHFSSIAGAGPIVGPIIAGITFGWLPTILWIVLGTIFIGGVHDFSSLIVSVRHEGKSIAEIANRYVNKNTYKLLLTFIWFALMYVVAVFTDLAAETFAKQPSVAEVSIIYILLAIIFGLLIYKVKFNLTISTIISLVLIIGGIIFCLQTQVLCLAKQTWIIILLMYCFLASILPVWILLQPRDYLSSYLLYFSVLIGLIGTIFGKYHISYPIFKGFNSVSIGPMVPFIFITVACGAVSGFHSLVSSGTTSKQLDNIKNARFVSYGGMILEGIVATIALSTVMILQKDSGVVSKPPSEIYAYGLSNFISLLGINPEIGKIFGLLVISAFILTTLDTATRISRYVFGELMGIKSNSILSRSASTIISLILPVILVNLKLSDSSGNITPCWKIIWPLFGSTNQLLAALVLLVIYLWARKTGVKNTLAIFIPTVFMLVMTFLALGSMVFKNVVSLISTILFLLSIVVIVEVVKTVFIRKT